MVSFLVLKSRHHRTTWIAWRAPGSSRRLNSTTLSRWISSRWWAWSRVRCPSGMPHQGSFLTWAYRPRMVLLQDGHVVRAATGQIGPVVMLGVQGVGGHHRVLQLKTVQQRREGRDLVVLGSDLPLGQGHAVVIHRRQQLDGRGRCGSRTTLPSTAITRRTGTFSVAGPAVGGVLACRYALIAASSASPSTRCRCLLRSPDPMPHNRHDATSLTRPVNRTNPDHAMTLVSHHCPPPQRRKQALTAGHPSARGCKCGSPASDRTIRPRCPR